MQDDYKPSTQGWVRDQVELYEKSGGTQGTTLRDTDLPVVIVTTRGARTGKIRKTPLMRVEHESRYAAVGSQGGLPTHPHWVHNIRTDPHVQVQDGPRKWEAVARELSGAEREEWWARAVQAFPPYDDYQRKTDRVIPVFLLEPVD